MPSTKLFDNVVILVVDDDPDSREMLIAVLEHEGATVIAADSGPTALNILSDFDPDVLISDLSMPDMDGIELIQEIRARERMQRAKRNRDFYLPAAAISAMDSAELRRRAFDAGFHCYIPKPTDVPLLLSVIVKLASARPPPNEAFRRPD